MGEPILADAVREYMDAVRLYYANVGGLAGRKPPPHGSPEARRLQEATSALTALLPPLDSDALVKPRTVWTHNNGTSYVVLAVTNTQGDDPELRKKYVPTVVYVGLENGKLWSRALSDWHRSMTVDRVLPVGEFLHAIRFWWDEVSRAALVVELRDGEQ